ATLTLADGSNMDVSYEERPNLVLENNGIGQLAVLLSLLPRESGRQEVSFFAPQVLAVRHTWLAQASGQEWETGLGLTVELDRDRRIVSGHAPNGVTLPQAPAEPLLWEDLNALRPAPTPRAASKRGITRKDLHLRSDLGTLGVALSV